MVIHDLYSKLNKEPSDIFIFSLTPKFRIQAVHIWNDFFNQLEATQCNSTWEAIHNHICREHGHKTLLEGGFGIRYKDSYKVSEYFENNSNTVECLDVIQIVLRFILQVPIRFNLYDLRYTPEQAIADFNTRFLENGIGFEFQNRLIIKVDNKLLHKEIIIPTLFFTVS